MYIYVTVGAAQQRGRATIQTLPHIVYGPASIEARRSGACTARPYVRRQVISSIAFCMWLSAPRVTGSGRHVAGSALEYGGFMHLEQAARVDRG
jgi:hypothetical protein